MTVREWFNQLPEPERTNALTERGLIYQDGECDSMAHALMSGIHWAGSRLGADYWQPIYRHYLKLENKKGRAPKVKRELPNGINEKTAEYLDI